MALIKDFKFVLFFLCNPRFWVPNKGPYSKGTRENSLSLNLANICSLRIRRVGVYDYGLGIGRYRYCLLSPRVPPKQSLQMGAKQASEGLLDYFVGDSPMQLPYALDPVVDPILRLFVV